MQNVGFCYSMLSIVGRFEHDESAVRAFLRRHLAFFNTNPTLATYVISAAAAAEAEGRPEEAVELKKAMSGPLGMAGDALFWGAVRPLAALSAVCAALLGSLWAAVWLLGLYNVPHLILRSRGAAAGGRGGPGASEVLGSGLRALVAAVRATLSFAAGLVVALALGRATVAPETLVIAGSFFLLTLLALRVRVPVTAIGLAGVVGGVAIMCTRF